MDHEQWQRGISRGRVIVGAMVAAALTALLGGPTVGATGMRQRTDFTPLATSAPCTIGGGSADQVPIVLPPGFAPTVVATEDGTNFLDNADMHTLNESGAEAGKYLFHTHEIRPNSAVSMTDLLTGQTSIIAQRADWDRLDGIRWTPWNTLIFAEEVRATSEQPPTPDPDFPGAISGLVYELDPFSGEPAVARPAIGARAHEGMPFDKRGNLYGVSEIGTARGGGAIFKFIPSESGDLSSGTLHALKVTSGDPNKTGVAEWVQLDSAQSMIDSDAAAAAAGATLWGQPEDAEVDKNTLYVAVSDEGRVIAIDVGPNKREHKTVVWDYVRAGVNAPATTPPTGDNAFSDPDNLAFDKRGNLFISEDVPRPGRAFGNDVWMAAPPAARTTLASNVVRFASLTDCRAEPSGPYFAPQGRTMYLHIMHRGGSGPVAGNLNMPDLSLSISFKSSSIRN